MVVYMSMLYQAQEWSNYVNTLLVLLGFAIYLYKTKSSAYLIPKAVYEWTGYTSSYSGLGSKNLN
ncbi:hypothetical protein BBBOND_0109110 [Babesia bigemina]|uniref:Uncharacterized protein n=1 Tax=Babesia bigemina TaxID=5866 RepID=A0A061D1U7_BABBI|nr:hypothetical protein BBBOND_0109110 [Babesia bigemina]CDR94613.1 hypothetical protein BBBOND_0109110 [Babesia bigemina]|eukprot:XP_012766799.1 hypothetical protein BBBOND_0109110 [Babesia bigemina]